MWRQAREWGNEAYKTRKKIKHEKKKHWTPRFHFQHPIRRIFFIFREEKNLVTVRQSRSAPPYLLPSSVHEKVWFELDCCLINLSSSGIKDSTVHSDLRQQLPLLFVGIAGRVKMSFVPGTAHYSTNMLYSVLLWKASNIIVSGRVRVKRWWGETRAALVLKTTWS